MNIEKLIDEYCKVVLTGLNLQKGQCMNVSCEPAHIPVMKRMSAQAYKMGAKFVQIRINSGELVRERLLNSEEGFLSFVPHTITAEQDVLIKDNWARLAVSSAEDPDVFHDVPQERNIVMQTAMRKMQEKYKQAVMTDKFNWNVCAIPTPKWAAKVMKKKANAATERALWKVLAPIYRLDQQNPVGAWQEHCQKLSHRSSELNALNIKHLRFQAAGTDFKVGLRQEALWKGGYSTSSTGVRFIPNLPTEEVFTTPDFHATEGRVRLTRPAIIFEREVLGAELEFTNGKVTKVTAKKNEETLRDLISVDVGAAQLGEVALVDSTSPIFKCKRIFYNILFDENASCHFAFGGAYPSCLKGGVKMSVAQRKAHGINQSVVHNDVMIGSEELDVSAVTYDGKSVQIIKHGVFHDIA